MASVRKRSWLNKAGQTKTGWMVDYIDQTGERQRKTFALKKAADAFALQAQLEVREGTHVTEADSVTVSAAGENWIATAEAEELEPTTIQQYRQHLRLHIEPFLGKTKLSRLNVPVIRQFADELRANGRSRTMVKYVIRSLGSLLADAQDRGLIIRNSVHNGARRDANVRARRIDEAANSKLAATFRPSRKSNVCCASPAARIESPLWSPYSRDCVLQNCVALRGRISTSRRPNLPSANGLIVIERLENRRPKPRSVLSPAPQPSCLHCANGSWLARMATCLAFPMALALSNFMSLMKPTVLGGPNSRRRSTRVWTRAATFSYGEI